MFSTPRINEPLTACLRVSDADAQLLAAALKQLDVFGAFCLCPPDTARGLASLRSVATERGALYSLACHRAMQFTGAGHSGATVLYLRTGSLARRDTAHPFRWHRPGETLLLPPGRPSELHLGAQSEVYLLRPLAPLNERALAQCPPGRLIEHFLQRARFFPDYRATTEATADLLLKLGRRPASHSHQTPNPEPLDSRVLKAIGLMENDPHWAFDLKELARHVGASERNLHYLMRAETGMPPYRYYQRTRLLRARLMLVDCRRPAPSISWVAIQQGFYHLGRFAGLYRSQFGELPSETLEWLGGLTREPAGRYIDPRCVSPGSLVGINQP